VVTKETSGHARALQAFVPEQQTPLPSRTPLPLLSLPRTQAPAHLLLLVKLLHLGVPVLPLHHHLVVQLLGGLLEGQFLLLIELVGLLEALAAVEPVGVLEERMNVVVVVVFVAQVPEVVQASVCAPVVRCAPRTRARTARQPQRSCGRSHSGPADARTHTAHAARTAHAAHAERAGEAYSSGRTP